MAREQPTSGLRSEEHTSELQSRDSISYAVFCLKKKNFHYYLRRTSFSFLSSSFSSLLFSFFFFFFFFMIRRPPISTLILTLFPYTTLFRSEKNVPLGYIQMRKSKDLVDWEFIGWAFPEIPTEAAQWVRSQSDGEGATNIWAQIGRAHV